MDRRRAAGALLALAVCITSSAAAPTYSNQTALDLYDAATEGCYYNFQHYGEGDRIMTNEPCLNCTCHNRMLMCYLRVCPFTKPIGQDCTVEKRADQCCPIVTCPDVPVDLLTSTSTSSPAEYGATGVGKLDKYGCSINGKYFSEGSKVPPTPNKPCEHCYCIRNMTTCVMQECTLHVDGCTPIYHKDVCCPVRYSCDHPEDEILGLDDMSTTIRPTPGFLLTTTTVSPVTQVTQDCVHNDQVFADGTSIKTEKACEHCYCMKGDIVCVVQECGTPMENEGKNCTSQPPREGQCCPDTYICEGDELTTEVPFDLSTQPLLEELTTLSPPRRTEEEGSGYRNEPDEPIPSEIPIVEPDVEGSGDELATMQPLDVSEKYTPGIDDTYASTEGQGLIEITKSEVEDERTTIEPDSELNTVPSGVSEPSVPKLTTLTEETKTSDEQEKTTTDIEYSTTLVDTLRTTKEGALHTTESSFRKEDELHAPADISTQKTLDEYTTLAPMSTKETHEVKEEMKPTIEDDISTQKTQDEYTTLAPMSTKETHEVKEEMKPIIEDETKITKPSLSDDSQTVTTTESTTSLPSDFSKPVEETSQLSEHTVSEIQSTTVMPEKTESTTINAYENEIEDNSTPQGAGRIPGEGDCLQAGITYRNDSSVPSINNCQTDCKCISSIIKCDPIICSLPPEYMSNCVPTYDSSESCCPTYVCDGSKETLPPQPHSQMSETESSTPTSECHGDQCEDQVVKIPEVPVCTSPDCLIEPSKIPQASDCGENCEDLEQTPIQPDLQTACGPTGCDEKTETTHHEPSSVLPMTPESCTDAECKQDVSVTPCIGENCKMGSTEGCQNEEDCKNIQDISKIDTSCEGDACKEIPVDCGATGCDVSPPSQEAAEICNNGDCKKIEEIEPVCPDGNCRRKETSDLEGKLPSECTDSNCVPQKAESPELSVPETVSTEPEIIPDISATSELQGEVTSSPETIFDQGSGMQTELPHEVETKVPQISTDTVVTESITDVPKLTDITTIVSESSQEETTPEPQTVEIKQTSELPTTELHDITTEISDTKIMESQPQDESTLVDKITTIPQPTSVESHTLSENEIVKDITETPITMISEAHEAESSESTDVGDFVTKIPDVFTSEQYDHSTQIQEETITKQEDDKLPKDTDTEQKLTTQSSVKKETDFETPADQEIITKSPVLASEITTFTLDKEQMFTTSMQLSESTEKSELPEVPEIYHVTTESPVEYPLDTQPALGTEYPSISEEKTEAITETADIIHESKATSPAILDEKMTATTPELSESQTTLSPNEFEFTKSQDINTEKLDIHTQEPILSTTISPEVHFTDKVTDQASTIKEKESNEISREPEPEGQEQRTTVTPSFSLEPELETEMPTSVTDFEDMSIKTESPLSSGVVPKEKLPGALDHTISSEQPEIETEEPSIQEEPSITEHEEFSSESPLAPELPIYIPVHPPTTLAEKDKSEQPDKEIPVIPVAPELMPEYIPSTTQRLEITTLEPDVVTQMHISDKDIKEPELDKSDESTQSPYSEIPDSDITEEHTERETAITSTKEEPQKTATESKLIGTEEEDITKTTQAPGSIVKDTEEASITTTPKITGVDTTEKQVSIDKIKTEPPTVVMPESSETLLPKLDEKEGFPTKTQKPQTELEETGTKISDQTTEQYDHSETLPDMIELVEHHPILDISTKSPIGDEVMTVSYEKPTTTYADTQKVDKEDKLKDTLTTIKPIISEIDHESTKSTEESTGAPSVTQGYEQTFDGEVSTKQQDIAEVGYTVTADEQFETERPEIPASEQPSMPDKETITEKTDISGVEPEGTPAQESSTEKVETLINEQEVILEEKPLTEKPETPVMEKDITRPEESTEKEVTVEPEFVTKEPESVETEYTTKPDKLLHSEPSEIPEMVGEKEITTERLATDAASYDLSKEPETFTSKHEITSVQPGEPSEVTQDEYVTKGTEAPVTEYSIPDQESVTKSEIEEESVPEKLPSTEKTIDVKHEVTSEKDASASETESPTTEIKFISSQESVTMVPESIELNTKPDVQLTTSTYEPEISITEKEIKPDKEVSTTVPDTISTEGEIKPDEKFSTTKPEISEIEHEGKPSKETTIIPETPVFEQEVKPSTERVEISDIEKETKPEVEQPTEQTEKPETSHEVIPSKERPELSTTEVTESQEHITSKPESTIDELETIPDEVTETTAIGHEGIPEQGSMTKGPESSIIDHDILSGEEPTTKQPTSSEIEEEEIPQKKATEQPETTETIYETSPEHEFATLKPETPVTDHEIELDQEFATNEPETPKLEHEMKPDKESSTKRTETIEKETSTELSEKPDTEVQPSTEKSEKPEIELEHATELSEIETQSPTERSEPEIVPEVSTEISHIPEVEPQSSTERVEIPEIEPQFSTERSQEPEIEPQSSTERVEEPELEPQSSTERLEEIYVKPESSTEQVEVPEIPETDLQTTSERSEIPEIESQPSTKRSDVPEIELHTSTEPSEVLDMEHETKSSEAPELEISKEPSTERVESEQEMKPVTEITEPVESEADNELIPVKESSTEQSEVSEIEHELMPSTERSETPEIKPIEASSTERTKTTEFESKEPEAAVTEHDVIDQQLSTGLPETSEIEHEIKPESGSTTERSEIPETTDGLTSILPSEDQTKFKPIEEEIVIKTTTEIPSSITYESTVAVDKEFSEKSTESSVPTEKTTSIISTAEIQKDVKHDEELPTLSATSPYPLKEEQTTTIISELEKLPTLETEIPVQTEHETEKPTESKDTTAPEEEFLTVTTKATTPKTEEVTPTQSSSYDKFTKPHDIPESELLPSSIAPEIPKPGFNEVQATDEVPSPDEDGHFAPSATGGYGGQETDYEDENQPFGPGTCRYGGKVYVSAQQIPRDDPCDFCFCFRSDIICLQQSCPPPIHGCHEEPIQGFCCPRYECPVSMANTLNITTTTTTTTTTLPPHFNLNAYQGAAQRRGCQIKGHTYKVGEVVRASSGPCLHCTCGGDGQMKCDPKACTPEPMLRQMIAAAVSAKRRR